MPCLLHQPQVALGFTCFSSNANLACLPFAICREAAQLARSLAELHGGLPALLVATAAEAPEAAAHLTPSAPAIASALFVAANEFVSADQELDAVLSAEQLLRGGLS